MSNKRPPVSIARLYASVGATILLALPPLQAIVSTVDHVADAQRDVATVLMHQNDQAAIAQAKKLGFTEAAALMTQQAKEGLHVSLSYDAHSWNEPSLVVKFNTATGSINPFKYGEAVSTRYGTNGYQTFKVPANPAGFTVSGQLKI